MISIFCKILFSLILNGNNNNLYFDCVEIPKISLFNYVLRIKRFTYLEKYHIIYALIYIKRFLEKDFYLNNNNIHKITGIAIMLSHKFLEDQTYDSKYYSKVLGIEIKEMNILELIFLYQIDWKLFVSDDEFEKNDLLFNT
jgi:hypothetical protein